MTRTRIHNLSISLDGFATGEGQRADAPMGHAGHRLHQWMFATRFGAPIVSAAGGSEGTDDAIARQHEPGIGAAQPRAGEKPRVAGKRSAAVPHVTGEVRRQPGAKLIGLVIGDFRDRRRGRGLDRAAKN